MQKQVKHLSQQYYFNPLFFYFSLKGDLLKKTDHGAEFSNAKKNCILILSNNIALVTINGMLNCWDLDAETCINRIKINIDVTCMLNFLNKYIIMGSNNGKLSVFNCASFKLVKQINAHSGHFPINSVIFYENDMFISCSHDNLIKIWSIDSNNCLRVINNSYGSNCLILSKDKERLICGGNSGNIRIWNIINGSFIKNINASGSLYLFEITNDNRLICAEKSGLIKIWNLFDYKFEKVLKCHLKRIETLKVINENELITYSQRDGTLKHWNLDIDKCVKSFNVSGTDCSEFF